MIPTLSKEWSLNSQMFLRHWPTVSTWGFVRRANFALVYGLYAQLVESLSNLEEVSEHGFMYGSKL